MRGKKSIRLSIEVNPEVRKSMEQMRDQMNAGSLVEVIRRSLSVYEILCEAKANGSIIQVRTESGEVKELLLV